MLTTGFFKSALEECADIIIRDDHKFNKKNTFFNPSIYADNRIF